MGLFETIIIGLQQAIGKTKVKGMRFGSAWPFLPSHGAFNGLLHISTMKVIPSMALDFWTFGKGDNSVILLLSLV